MITTMKNYAHLPAHKAGRVNELDEILPLVRKFWPNAHMQGSAGLSRCFMINNPPDRIVAVTYGTDHRNKIPRTITWRYRIFKEPQEY